jgi:hypothetical protein
MQDSALEEYNGFLVSGGLSIGHPNCHKWTAQGFVYSAKTRSPLVQIQHIEGSVFKDKAEAIQHGLTLARRWVDQYHDAEGR